MRWNVKLLRKVLQVFGSSLLLDLVPVSIYLFFNATAVELPKIQKLIWLDCTSTIIYVHFSDAII